MASLSQARTGRHHGRALHGGTQESLPGIHRQDSSGRESSPTPAPSVPQCRHRAGGQGGENSAGRCEGAGPNPAFQHWEGSMLGDAKEGEKAWFRCCSRKLINSGAAGRQVRESPRPCCPAPQAGGVCKWRGSALHCQQGQGLGEEGEAARAPRPCPQPHTTLPQGPISPRCSSLQGLPGLKPTLQNELASGSSEDRPSPTLHRPKLLCPHVNSMPSDNWHRLPAVWQRSMGGCPTEAPCGISVKHRALVVGSAPEKGPSTACTDDHPSSRGIHGAWALHLQPQEDTLLPPRLGVPIC